MAIRCAELKIRAERRGGELLAGMEKNKGAAAPVTTLSGLGLTKNQSSAGSKLPLSPRRAIRAAAADDNPNYQHDTKHRDAH